MDKRVINVPLMLQLYRLSFHLICWLAAKKLVVTSITSLVAICLFLIGFAIGLKIWVSLVIIGCINKREC